ncbi:MAG TPA: alpha-amylase family protein [Acidobacteriaceae bacterium]
MLNRRAFLKAGAVALPLAGEVSSLCQATGETGSSDLAAAATLVPLPPRLSPPDAARLPWQVKIRRVGQSNMTEHDPAVMSVEEWADYWHGAGAEIVFVSVTGILAFYPSKVPFHRWGKFLNGRDFFGECTAAAKKRGMRVVARMSPDLNWPDALAAHPEWAMRNADGSPQRNGEDPDLFRTCMFSSYMDDYVPAIMREINLLYDVDCFYTNGWPPIGSLPDCHCAVCSKLPPTGTPAYWRAFNDRLFSLWQRYDGIAKEKKADSFFFANLGGNVHASPNLARLGRIAAWFQGDNQGRTNADPAIWGCALQARVCKAVLGEDSFAANINAAYSTGLVRWRNGSKNPEETRMWMHEALAGGLPLYNHFIGSEDGFGADRRWQKVGAEVFQWSAQHDAHLTPRRSLANIGLVMGQSTQVLYKGPAAAHATNYMHETTQGIYEALLAGRFSFDFVHEELLEPERLSKYRVLLLPNVALLSEAQCGQIRDYVARGGSLLASFETSLYDENLRPRSNFGLGDLFGIRRAGDVVGTNGNAYYARIERQHPVLDGFTGTEWIPGAQNRVPLEPSGDPVLTVVPGFVQYPPELAYPPVSHTNEPALVLSEMGTSRLAWFPGDIERTLWLTGHGDLLRLMHNTLRWLTRDERVVEVAGEGFIELFAWETGPGYAVHLLNYTNPNSHHGWVNSVFPLGPQRVGMRLPTGVRVRKVELLRAGNTVPFRVEDQTLRFTVPGVGDYEVAAITVA